MLHAFLHGKIDESLPELDRREDALTSTVFGALVWTGSQRVAQPFLSAIVRVSSDTELLRAQHATCPRISRGPDQPPNTATTQPPPTFRPSVRRWLRWNRG